MKPLYNILFFLFCSHFAMAQDISVDKEIKKIDSLIEYKQLGIAQRKTDSLHNLLDNFKKTNKHKQQLLELKFRQVLILERQEKSSIKPLKILQEIIDEAKNNDLHSLTYRIYLLTALCYEKADNIKLTDQYLEEAYKIYKKHKLDSLYSTYCIRRSSYHRFDTENLDSIFHYAKKANEYAKKYRNEAELTDSYILLGFVANKKKNYEEALKLNLQLLHYRKKQNDSLSIAATFNSISKFHIDRGDFHKALIYSDSVQIFNPSNVFYNLYVSETRYRIFEGLGNKDSAHYYLKQYIEDYKLWKGEDEKTKIKELEELYQNDKKEAAIKSKNQQMILIGSLLGLIVIASILLILQNRRINSRNKIISRQLQELTKTLDQKQVLLSELQHRVKNNLQHVISILEIQKESVDFNNIDELIRGNQNRIHSMALIHRKLNVSDNVNDVDLKRYVTELSELVKESYDNHKKKISLDIKCEVETIYIEKALPLGLIITELVSNSMKHAFKKQSIGIINIEITKGQNRNKLYYSDSGSGFDFDKVNEKGLGQEIIKGLIDQLDGTVETSNDNGFEITISFK